MSRRPILRAVVAGASAALLVTALAPPAAAIPPKTMTLCNNGGQAVEVPAKLVKMLIERGAFDFCSPDIIIDPIEK